MAKAVEWAGGFAFNTDPLDNSPRILVTSRVARLVHGLAMVAQDILGGHVAVGFSTDADTAKCVGVWCGLRCMAGRVGIPQYLTSSLVVVHRDWVWLCVGGCVWLCAVAPYRCLVCFFFGRGGRLAFVRTSDGAVVARQSPHWIDGLESCAATGRVVCSRAIASRQGVGHRRLGYMDSGPSHRHARGAMATLRAVSPPSGVRDGSGDGSSDGGGGGDGDGHRRGDTVLVPVLGRGQAVVGVVAVTLRGEYDEEAHSSAMDMLSRFSAGLGAGAQVADDVQAQVCLAVVAVCVALCLCVCVCLCVLFCA